ncbi:PucR family transcriptional regulator [Nocardia sp. ET3-3]|uniref:PucR family transcriptional regulator n=1 Tax=Nocardia terrae TaxID=2675851 RepID=A0A7K1V9V3_9NOCA|nr:PucR family transcriptional regulator [Nocardia terrae]MVU83327.1 PucR family transcriptional regulator [Nocardia terrae]
MPVPLGWVLTQPDLALRLRGGSAGLRRDIDLVVTTELEPPFRWLSGGELVLTTGMRLPPDPAGRTEYVRELDRCGVAGIGFGIGLTHDEIPLELITAADEIGIPLFEVPLATAFAAIVERVSARIAELQYDAVLRASRAQPRMTRALIRSGSAAIVRELANSLDATVLVIDPNGTVIDSHPGEPAPELVARVRAAVLETAAAGAGVWTDSSGASITHQRIGLDRRRHGHLVVVGDTPLGPVDQILLGHANSLLALDFEQPARLHRTQHRLNGQALGLLLGASVDPSPAWEQLALASDARGRIKILVVVCDSESSAESVEAALTELVPAAGHSLFAYREATGVVLVLPADSTFAESLRPESFGGSGELIRMGVSGGHPLRDLAAAVESARLAASTAEPGSPPVDFTTLMLLSFPPAREVLEAMAHTRLTALVDYDRRHGTDLLAGLRAFLECNGQWESAAATLRIHRHTLRKRIATAAEILALDLDSARVRAELLLALLATAGTWDRTR